MKIIALMIEQRQHLQKQYTVQLIYLCKESIAVFEEQQAGVKESAGGPGVCDTPFPPGLFRG